jgi:hypothetical protein
MLEAVAAAQDRLQATRAAKLEEVYGDQAEASPHGPTPSGPRGGRR